MKKKHLKWDTLRIVLNSRKVIKLKNTNVFEIIKLKFGDFGYLSMHGSSNEIDVTIFNGREIIYQLPTQWLSDNF